MSANSDAMTQWRISNPDYMHNWYLANRDSRLSRGREWRKRNPEYHSEYSKEYYQANSEAVKLAVSERAKENPEMIKARGVVNSAIRRGEIDRPEACSICGRTEGAEYHHPDYAKPLETVTLCRSCHKRLHVGVLV